MSKIERKNEIKDLLADLREGDLPAIKVIIQKMSSYGLDPKLIRTTAYLKNGDKLSDAQKKLIAEASEKFNAAPDPNELSLDSIFETCGTEEKKALALEQLTPLYRHGNLETDTTDIQRIFRVVDQQERVCKELVGDSNKVGITIQRGLAEKLAQEGNTSSPKTISMMEDYWSLYDKPISSEGNGVQTCYSVIFENEPEYDSVWCLYKSTYRPDSSVPFPLLFATLNRMSEGDAFAAWIWGVYSRKYKGRQVFWIYGPNGEEGKSYLGKFLGNELFGENYGYKVINNLKNRSRNQFTTSAYVGSKLVVYPDCNDRKILWTELFKSLAGGGRDSEVIEEKYGLSNTVTLEARGLIISNLLPELKRENWLLSRLALCKIEPFSGSKDPEIDKKYRDELPGFLAYAKACYETLCPDNEEIELKQETRDWINDLIEQQEPLWKDVFIRYFAIAPDSFVSFKRMKQLMEVSEGFRERSQTEWHEYLLNIPGVSALRKASGFVYTGIRELTAIDSLATESVKADPFSKLDKKMAAPVPSFEEMEKSFRENK